LVYFDLEAVFHHLYLKFEPGLFLDEEDVDGLLLLDVFEVERLALVGLTLDDQLLDVQLQWLGLQHRRDGCRVGRR